MLGTIARTGQVLDLFTADKAEWGVTEVAATIGVAKSNAHDVLSSLAGIGLLQRTSGGRYQLGWRLLTMTLALMDGAELRHASARDLRGLCGAFEDPVKIAAWDNDQVVVVGQVARAQPSVTPAAAVGGRLSVSASAAGRVLLAHADRPRAVAGTDAAVLQVVRERGYAYDEQGCRTGVCCIAAPVRDSRGTVVAAISMSTTPARFAHRGPELLAATIGAAGRITNRLTQRAGARRWSDLQPTEPAQPRLLASA
jgi:IclR family KDG regulon transcriptional repressor